ncbi:hypothetical protein A6J71_00165 [Enterobacter cancerogenus]|uniref:type II toxin-antitoxin system TacA family antitoxin n=1 Tax=Enterobacter cancerogenus TaxID=69218 RepID=UPI000C9CD748|nr:DUF1778 domain-containing protein [Enterobacter cancerogenus]PNF13489.1 hypothetical protein A6J71_00165 [Enterobacter cancerogenus]
MLVKQLLYKKRTHEIRCSTHLRTKESQRALIDGAAEILHNSRTDFIMEMTCQAAENVILDSRVFNFNDGQYIEFIDMLVAPVADDPAIDKLLTGKPQWDL